ncbi:MAG: PIN domain nuclease [Clostridiales bacterium]|nr:PIN domain nuclease [Clostridiales bacterium]
MHNETNTTYRVIRVIIAVSAGGIGATLGLFFLQSAFFRMSFLNRGMGFAIVVLVVLTALMVLIGYIAGPFLILQAKQWMQWWESRLIKIPAADLMGSIIGLIIGLIIAFFLGSSLSDIPVIGRFLPTLASIFFGYLGASIGMKKRDELIHNIDRIRNRAVRDRKKDAKLESESDLLVENLPSENVYFMREVNEIEGIPKILDTSVIIDGRISDIYRTGFLSGTIIIPGFVLVELQHIADSSDVLKRNRGRRGLDILNTMRKEMQEDIRVIEAVFPDIPDVDTKLIMLARQIGGEILTNDYNLNKVAELQGIQVLNINDLVNALKQVFLPGEEITVTIIKEGKEQRQGIGYLDDGTMIVVENGKKYISYSIYTVVTSVLQTSAGRMIFVKPKYSDKRVYAEVSA